MKAKDLATEIDAMNQRLYELEERVRKLEEKTTPAQIGEDVAWDMKTSGR